jgi:DNA-binding MurR/RpiR family transcriptional regulator
MPRVSPPSFLSRVRSARPKFHASERRLAEAILNFPGQLASYTASEIAGMAGVSPATMTRFVRKIGYASFEEARQAVRAEQQAGAALLRSGGEAAAPRDAVRRHRDRARANLDATFARVDDAALEAAVDAMRGARRVAVIGHRAGQPFARYLGWQVAQVLDGVQVLPRDGETLAEAVSAIGPEDVVVLFLLRRVPVSADALCVVLAESGAAVLLIGDVDDLEGRPARWRFPCETSSDDALFEHTSVMALCNLLAARVIDRIDAAARAKLTRIADLHDRLDEV